MTDKPSSPPMTPEALQAQIDALDGVAHAIAEYQCRAGASRNVDEFNGVERGLGFVHAAIKRCEVALASAQPAPAPQETAWRGPADLRACLAEIDRLQAENAALMKCLGIEARRAIDAFNASIRSSREG